jgi:hypothetical protein
LVRDSIAPQQRAWLALLEGLARAQKLGELDPDTDPAQLAFELHALLVAANTSFILQGTRAHSTGRATPFASASLPDHGNR